MYFFQTYKPNEKDLLLHFKRKVGWENWLSQLKTKSESYLSSPNKSTLWFNQAGLTNERLNSLAETHTQLSTNEARLFLEQRIKEALVERKGDVSGLINQLVQEITQLKIKCSDLEEELNKAVTPSEQVLGSIAHSISTQPSFAFGSTCFSELALSARNDPQLANYLTLDDLYLGFFRNLSGGLLLTLEVGLYFYLNLQSALTLMLIQGLLSTDKARSTVFNYSEHYFPGQEFSVLSGIKNNASLIGTLFFLTYNCGMQDLTSQAWMKWGILAVTSLSIERLSSRFSAGISRALLGEEQRHKAFLLQSMVHNLILICSWIYMYPWLAQTLDATLKTTHNPKATALETLGLEDSASTEEIRKRVKSLLRQHHPDQSIDPSARELTQKILAAANILKEAKPLNPSGP